MTTDNPCWQTVAPAALLWAEWPVDQSLFDAASGETHLLSDLPAVIIQQLSQRPWKQAELSRWLAAECGVTDDPTFRAQLTQTLATLAELELIETVPDHAAVIGVSAVGRG